MRLLPGARIAVATACAAAAGPALASAVSQAHSAHLRPSVGTAPFTSTTAITTGTGTTTTQPTRSPAVIRATCRPGARNAIARALRVPAAAVTVRFAEGNNGMPQCTFRVGRARYGGPRTRVAVTVNVDDAPQAGWRLMRTVVEAQQLWGGITPSGKKQPVGLSGLGPYASWFPELHALMANNVDRKRLIEVTVGWRRATRAQMIRLARAAIMPYRRTR